MRSTPERVVFRPEGKGNRQKRENKVAMCLWEFSARVRRILAKGLIVSDLNIRFGKLKTIFHLCA